ncbi:chromosome condensation regulator RCC1 [Corallococcus praedator]|uniref:Chromosome condensation regulator RCC1 n=1 Tax=Corallococcus praedator TaxID=2316724 RepID=A0ABX9QG10_9BACT|nr:MULTISPECIES: Ig-like domain-containing protein [Corallococcus]RKH27247.1 chromosome condensation regulator RCC1 [Corallococcus sp. CA031C]RKI06876.1 chromosome condensation regulator RCC1 [Corallococcus praedator]
MRGHKAMWEAGLLAAAMLLGACGDDPVPLPPDNTDAGVTLDAGTGTDAGTDAGTQVAAPTVSFTSPTEGAQVEQAQVQVEAVVRAEGGIALLTVKHNGGPVTDRTPLNGPKEQVLTVPVEAVVGENTVTLHVEDEAGQSNDATLHFTYGDVRAPTVALTSPTEGQDLTVYQVRVTGRATDNFGVKDFTAQLNGGTEQPESVSTDGAFTFVLTPARGDNTLVLRARDASGNATEKKVHFRFGRWVTGGGSHSALLRDGKVYVWGNNNLGQLGLGQPGPSAGSTPSPLLLAELPPVGAVAFGQNSSLAVGLDGTVWTWGDNKNAQLGLGVPGSGALDVTTRWAPARVPSLTNAVTAVRGYTHALVLANDNTVWAFGSNGAGQLGDDTTKTASDVPVKVVDLTDVIQVAAGSEHSVALRADGTVWTWGRNSSGNLGLGTTDSGPHARPAQVPGLTDVVEISAGKDHTLALRANGAVVSWGLGVSGQLGQGQSGDDGNSAVPVAVLDLTNATSVAANGNVSFALRADGTVVGWGQNANGTLGTGDKVTRTSPSTAVVGLTDVTTLGVGALHAISVRRDGSIFGWGWNVKGCLGGGPAAKDPWAYSEPLQVTLP